MRVATVCAAFLFFLAVGVSVQAQTATACLAHHFQYIENQFEVRYEPGCTGHDEPELDPVSSASGSARDLTWTVVLPSDGASVLVSDVGPTFWFGGTVTDPKSFLGQAFVELQFYPDAIVKNCFPNGAFNVSFAPNTYSACSPVFALVQDSNGKFREPAAFNAMLTEWNRQQESVADACGRHDHRALLRHARPRRVSHHGERSHHGRKWNHRS